MGKMYLLAPKLGQLRFIWYLSTAVSLNASNGFSGENYLSQWAYLQGLMYFVSECQEKVTNTGKQKIFAAAFGLFQLHCLHVTLQIVSSEKVTFHSGHIFKASFSLMVRV